MAELTLRRVSDQVFAVMPPHGEAVGNLKLINGVWKFKALGYDASGGVMPGHGPLTDKHNLRFTQFDAGAMCDKLTAL